MEGPADVYTYQAGRKVWLRKRPNQFVVRALPTTVQATGIAMVEHAEQVSSASSRVTTTPENLERAMSEARAVAPTHHAYELADSAHELLLTDRIFVTFHEPLPDAAVDAFAQRYGLVLKTAYSDRVYLFQLTDRTGMNPVKLIVKLTEDEPQVQTAEHDLNRRATPSDELRLPTDEVYTRQWHLHERLVDPLFDPRSSSRCEAAWQLLEGYGSPDVVVGFDDDGCKLDHPDLDSSDKFVGWAYFEGERLVTDADDDADRARMFQDQQNHGTSCAGLIAAELDATLTVGAAPNCRLLPIKWDFHGSRLNLSDSKLLSLVNFIADKVDILSSSWADIPQSLWASVVRDRITELAQTGGRRGRGIVFVRATGNEDCPIQYTATQPIPYTNGWNLQQDPAEWIGVKTASVFENDLVGIPGVVHVAALSSFAQRSHYSNYGTGIGICAPSSNSHRFRRMPTVTGLRIRTTTGDAAQVTRVFGGTSSATPLVAGIAALVISANPELTALDVISILKRTASKDLSLDGYDRTPPEPDFDPDTSWDVSPIDPFDHGDFQDSGDPDGTWSPWFGHGRVDAAAAVAEAQRLLPAPLEDELAPAEIGRTA